MTQRYLAGVALGVLMSATALSGAIAGEEPYVATVCDDTGRTSSWCGSNFGVRALAFPDFYLSAKEYQFTHTNRDETTYRLPTGASVETFRPSAPINQQELCDVLPNARYPSRTATWPGQHAEVIYNTNLTARVPYFNAGYYEWRVVLPKKPRGNLNIALQCAVLKPQEIDVTDCAAEMGERQGPGSCNPAFLNPGRNPVLNATLPRLTAAASPGPWNPASFSPFNLTAYRNPSPYALSFGSGGAISDGPSSSILAGGVNARINLKSCFTKSIFVKQPVSGQVNARGQVESDLEAGDRIFVRLDVPRGHPMDIYCHAQSLKVLGIGDGGTLID